MGHFTPGDRAFWLFVVVAFAWSWLFWTPQFLWDFSPYVAPFGPSVATLLLTYKKGRMGRRIYCEEVRTFVSLKSGVCQSFY